LQYNKLRTAKHQPVQARATHQNLIERGSGNYVHVQRT